MGAEGRCRNVIELLGENRIGSVRIYPQLLGQPPPLLLIAQHITGSLYGSSPFSSRTRGRLGIPQPPDTAPNPIKEAPDSTRQPSHRIHRVHHHVTSRFQ